MSACEIFTYHQKSFLNPTHGFHVNNLLGSLYACNKGKSASWYWWLRSANNIEYAGFVSEGELGYGEEVDRNMGIRPAMWIEISE